MKSCLSYLDQQKWNPYTGSLYMSYAAKGDMFSLSTPGCAEQPVKNIAPLSTKPVQDVLYT